MIQDFIKTPNGEETSWNSKYEGSILVRVLKRTKRNRSLETPEDP